MVSVVIPVYNAEEYLIDALESCIAQNTNVLTEIILVDDHSTDNSRSIMNAYKAKHPRLISVLDNPTKGGQSARNHGIRHSNGKYIQFLDADDILSPDKIESQLKLLSAGPKNAIASCRWLHFKVNPNDAQNRRQNIDKSYDIPTDWLVESWSGNGMGQTGIWLIPREVIKVTGEFDETLHLNQDGDYFSRVIMNCSRILFDDSVTVYYRKPKVNNVSLRKSDEAIDSALRSYKKYEAILTRVDTEQVRRALCRNYETFVYQNYNRHRDLSRQAIAYSKALGFVQFKWTNSTLFSFLSKAVGFKTAFFLRNAIKGF